MVMRHRSNVRKFRLGHGLRSHSIPSGAAPAQRADDRSDFWLPGFTAPRPGRSMIASASLPGCRRPMACVRIGSVGWCFVCALAGRGLQTPAARLPSCGPLPCLPCVSPSRRVKSSATGRSRPRTLNVVAFALLFGRRDWIESRWCCSCPTGRTRTVCRRWCRQG